MDKITHQTRAEHWTKILNECINSGLSKTAWCRANGISEKQFFYWQRILRREAFESSQNPELPATVQSRPQLPAQKTVTFTEIKLSSAPQNTVPVFRPDQRTHVGRWRISSSFYKRVELESFHWPRTK